MKKRDFLTIMLGAAVISMALAGCGGAGENGASQAERAESSQTGQSQAEDGRTERGFPERILQSSFLLENRLPAIIWTRR